VASIYYKLISVVGTRDEKIFMADELKTLR